MVNTLKHMENVRITKFKGYIISASKQIGAFFKWVLFAVIIGVVVGFAGAVFAFCINQATALRNANGWLVFLLPIGGLAIVLIYRRWGMPNSESTNFVLTAVRENTELPLRTAPLIFVSTVITHLFGGSAGREGAALQLGGSISAAIGRSMKLDEKDERMITMCGMAAGFASMFGTPIAAAVFAMEVISVGVMYYSALVPCLLSALIGNQIAQLMGLSHASYILNLKWDTSLITLVRVAGLAVLFAVLSIVFCQVMHGANKLYSKYFKNPFVRVAVGGFIVVALTILEGSGDYNGAGGEIISGAIAGDAAPIAFLLKMVFTAVTLGAGFKGGEIVPAFFTGATFGCVAAPFFGLPSSLGAALGMISVFCGVTNCPMTSFIIAIELFGGNGIPLFALSCGISYMLSGYYGLYSEQKIMYSKFKAEFIGLKAK